MQFYLDGFYAGDPAIVPAGNASATRPLEDQGEVDVLIAGTGPAGLVLAAQLAQFDGITTRIVERRDGPLELGQADGVACRTMEMLEHVRAQRACDDRGLLGQRAVVLAPRSR